MAMSIYLVLGLLLVGIGQIAALPEELEKLAALLHKQCVKETNVKEEAISDARLGIFATDRELKCYMKCVYLTSGVVNEEGEINGAAIMEMVPEALKKIIQPIIDKCIVIESPDLCEKIFQVNVCFQTNGPAYYYLA